MRRYALPAHHSEDFHNLWMGKENQNTNNETTLKECGSYVAFCIAFIAAAPVLNASTVSVVAFAPSNNIICTPNIYNSQR